MNYKNLAIKGAVMVIVVLVMAIAWEALQ